MAEKRIREELKSNKTMLPQRMDLLLKVQQHCSAHNILPGQSVGFMTHALDTGMGDAYARFSALEKDSIHFIYSYFREVDEFLRTFEERIMRALENGGIDDPFGAFAGRAGDYIESLRLAEKAIEKFERGDPVDFLYRKSGVTSELGKLR